MAAPKGGHYEGMPQLDPTFMPNLIFWLIITLIAVYFLLSRIALPRIGGIIEDRQTAIQNDLDQAAELKQKAEGAMATYEQALTDARAEAQTIAAQTRAEIQKELDVAIAKADAEIAAKAVESEARIGTIRASAMANVEEVAKDVSGDITNALAPKTGTKTDLNKAIAAILKDG